MVGVSNINQILAATAYVTASNKEKDCSEVLANAPRSSFSGHCAPCSKKIDIASVNKYLDLALIQEDVPETLMNHYDLLKHYVNECIECGLCVKNCLFGVNVINKMKQAVKPFGN